MNLMNFYILAGGKSRRMGTDKANLPAFDKPMLAIVRDALPAAPKQIAIIANAQEAYSGYRLRTIPDLHPGIGPLGGIHAGLVDSAFASNFFIACDMPLVSTNMIETLISEYQDEDVLGFCSPAGREPLCAIYSKSILPLVAKHIAEQKYSLQTLISSADARFISCPEPKRLANINTPEDANLLQKGLIQGSAQNSFFDN